MSKLVFPKQRELMRSSAQIGSGVCRCGWEAQAPEGSGKLQKVADGFEGSARFQEFPVQGCRFRKVPEGSGAGPCGCKLQAQIQGFGGLRNVLEGSGAAKYPYRTRTVIPSTGRGRVPEGFDAVLGSAEFRQVL